jgi:hypothetical protein
MQRVFRKDFSDEDIFLSLNHCSVGFEAGTTTCYCLP